MVISNNNLKIKGWNYLCNYKNNISNIKMNINLFYKFTVNKPKKIHLVFYRRVKCYIYTVVYKKDFQKSKKNYMYEIKLLT